MSDDKTTISEVFFEELADIELEFEETENAIIRMQVELQAGLYEKRHELINKIPNFWSLVFEQAPADIDEYIMPTDAAALLSSLVSLKVNHFEIEGGDSGMGEPRSIKFTFEFRENEYFNNTIIEKKFYFRYGKGDWSGFVSEPVTIDWKEGKDLTEGMLDLAKKVYDDDMACEAAGTAKSDTPTDNEKKLIAKLENSAAGGVSFFAWFGYRGRRVTDAEHKEQKSILAARRAGNAPKKTEDEKKEDEEEDEDDDDDHEYDIFVGGADLAICLADDLFPNAIKYFTQAHELENMSDSGFETEEEDDE
ncbi:putative nucleosome assembly protein C36B7.08c [Ceratocystis lukuohia]|uniref:Nucleosome assembly protein C36B7.08c n=1 Tax=Ceratocystis lukuohia TaxID=2019550 RepID=A0ABR4MML6_9PEZI